MPSKKLEWWKRTPKSRKAYRREQEASNEGRHSNQVEYRFEKLWCGDDFIIREIIAIGLLWTPSPGPLKERPCVVDYEPVNGTHGEYHTIPGLSVDRNSVHQLRWLCRSSLCCDGVSKRVLVLGRDKEPSHVHDRNSLSSRHRVPRRHLLC